MLCFDTILTLRLCLRTTKLLSSKLRQDRQLEGLSPDVIIVTIANANLSKRAQMAMANAISILIDRATEVAPIRFEKLQENEDPGKFKY